MTCQSSRTLVTRVELAKVAPVVEDKLGDNVGEKVVDIGMLIFEDEDVVDEDPPKR